MELVSLILYKNMHPTNDLYRPLNLFYKFANLERRGEDMPRAVAQCSSFSYIDSFPRQLVVVPLPSQKKKRLLLLPLSSTSTSSSSPLVNQQQLNRRKNHLRQKLLKTLTNKPYPKHLLPQPPYPIIIPIKPPSLQVHFDTELEPKEVIISQENEQVIITNKVLKGEFGKLWFFNLGLYLVGIFVFQTICAVWLFGSGSEEGKDGERSNLSERGELGFRKGYLGSSGVEEKLVEIQAMARDVRESERLKSKTNKSVDDDGVVRFGIEREVNSKLVKLQKRLRESGMKMPAFPVNRERGDLEVKGIIGPLMIKKKYKFRGPSSGSSDKPKGFSGSKGSRVSESNSSMLAVEDEKGGVFSSVDQLSDNSSVSDGPPSKKDAERKQNKETAKPSATPNKKLGEERLHAKRRKDHSNAEPASGMGATQKANLGRALESNETAIDNKRSKDKIGQWWSSLPYVLVVLMCRGDDGEGPRGLFTLKSKQGLLSHIVAFEDRGDATNFCYILESFFEDLGDFSANVVPLSVEELKEEVTSHTKKVVVVKKGQLKLYAGQPLTEVEMALCSLVDDN